MCQHPATSMCQVVLNTFACGRRYDTVPRCGRLMPGSCTARVMMHETASCQSSALTVVHVPCRILVMSLCGNSCCGYTSTTVTHMWHKRRTRDGCSSSAVVVLSSQREMLLASLQQWRLQCGNRCISSIVLLKMALAFRAFRDLVLVAVCQPNAGYCLVQQQSASKIWV
jgi:hypothetical protein